jgi:hypothetical protein
MISLSMLNSFSTETILRYPSIITLTIFVVGALIGWGIYKNIIARLREDVTQHSADIHSLREWGEARIAEAVAERNELFVRKELFEHYMQEMKRRLDTLDAMEIGAQLAEIKAMLVAIKEQINQK